MKSDTELAQNRVLTAEKRSSCVAVRSLSLT